MWQRLFDWRLNSQYRNDWLGNWPANINWPDRRVCVCVKLIENVCASFPSHHVEFIFKHISWSIWMLPPTWFKVDWIWPVVLLVLGKLTCVWMHVCVCVYHKSPMTRRIRQSFVSHSAGWILSFSTSCVYLVCPSIFFFNFKVHVSLAVWRWFQQSFRCKWQIAYHIFVYLSSHVRTLRARTTAHPPMRWISKLRIWMSDWLARHWL